MCLTRIVLLSALFSLARAQQVGNWYAEVHPPFTTWQCTQAGGCRPLNTSIVLDAKIRPLHIAGSSQLCTTKERTINATYCFDAENCHHNCVYEGLDYPREGVHVQSAGNQSAIQLDLFTNGIRKTPRVYVLDEATQNYQMIPLGPGTEFTFDMDASALPCGPIGAIYLVQMNADGGRSQYNEAGAAYGTGYCDAQCHVRDFYNGEPNTNSSGSCCAEIDLFEGSRIHHSMSVHPCKTLGLFPCRGVDCNHSREGGQCSMRYCGAHTTDNPDLFGYHKDIDTTRPFTVVTQFLSAADLAQEKAKAKRQHARLDRHGSAALDAGGLQERASEEMALIRQIHIQDGRSYIKNSTDWVMATRDRYCPKTGFLQAGGVEQLGKASRLGMVLAFSIFNGNDDWLTRVTDTCIEKESYYTPQQLLEDHQHTAVTFSSIRWGELGSTYRTDGQSWLASV